MKKRVWVLRYKTKRGVLSHLIWPLDEDVKATLVQVSRIINRPDGTVVVVRYAAGGEWRERRVHIAAKGLLSVIVAQEWR